MNAQGRPVNPLYAEDFSELGTAFAITHFHNMSQENNPPPSISANRERRAKQAALGKKLRQAYGEQNTSQPTDEFLDLLRAADNKADRPSRGETPHP